MHFGPCLSIAMLSVLACATTRAQAPLRFHANIHAGDAYTHALGHGLYFSLNQVDSGEWDFQIRPTKQSSVSYIDCVGSPFLHGPDPVNLTAWRFASGADPDWAERLPAKKQFSFATSAADHRYECAESQAMYDSSQRSQSKGKNSDYSGLPHYKPKPLGEGKVTVTFVALKPGLNGQNAEFSEIALDVTIRFPYRGRPTRRQD